MGCYLSAPDNRVFVSEGKGKNFVYATASCQGWRREQEDAEECIPYFDDNASLFVLCDGHGGAEVAKYTVDHLPDFIKNHPLYKEGKYEKALENAFIEFDALLRTDEVMAELNKLAFDEEASKKSAKEGGKVLSINNDENQAESNSAAQDPEPSSSAGPSSSNNGSLTTVVDDVDTETLKQEALVPLRELLDKYSAIVDTAANKLLSSKYQPSPVVRKRDRSADASGSVASPSTSKADTSSALEDQPGPSSSKSSSIDQQASSSTEAMSAEALHKRIKNRYFPDDEQDEDSSDDSEFDGDASSNDEDGDDEGDDDAGGEGSTARKLRRKKHKPQVDDDSDSSSGISDDDDDDDEDDDEEVDDERVDIDDDESDDSELKLGEDDDEDDEEDEEEEGDEEEEDEEDDDNQWVDLCKAVKPGQRAHKPGLDSGCTVVVALIKDGKLYVASAGDSRCIMIYRSGECKPLTFDHKPEDLIERKRISKAGGHVTDGRVNGGLNLSRALGDFTYKNPNLDARDQMITACPDVKTADLNPDEVEYILLACDGIWNSMKNQEAAKFVRKVAPTVENDLVEICVQLFRNCIAPKTDGDGTGCDNMTCILARFGSSSAEENLANSDLKSELKESETNSTSSQKRSTNDDDNDPTDNAPATKRRCLRL